MIFNKKICIVIPCFNVANEIEKVINKIDLKIVDKIFIIDDCCPQKTGKNLKKKKKKKLDITILKKNIGVGGATIFGFKKALRLDVLKHLQYHRLYFRLIFLVCLYYRMKILHRSQDVFGIN